jgi:arylsulfatase
MNRPTGVITAAAALALFSACSEPAPDAISDPVPGVLLISVDTLRADRLGSYGYRLDTSPNIDALAARGVRFENASVQWPKTWPSMASLLSGAYPKTTSIQFQQRVLPQSLLMLSEVFGNAGYASAAVVSNFNVGRALGFDQGFDHFVESWQAKYEEEQGPGVFVNEPGKVKNYTNATLVTDQGLRWLKSRDAGKPFFLWLHYMDPHGPYLPPPEYKRLFEGQHRNVRVPSHLLPKYQEQMRLDEVTYDLGHYNAQYDREIRYLDDELGRLFAALDELGIGDSLIVLTADHGESMGEHKYYFEHGALPYQPTAHVPLIVAQRGAIEGGRTVEQPVGLIEVAPTLAELSGIAVPTSHEGVSLAGVIRGDVSPPLPPRVFTEGGYSVQNSQLTVREGRWKLIHIRSPRERTWMTGEEFELYDLNADPEELTNVANDFPEVAGRLRADLAGWYTGGERAEDVNPAIELDKLEPESREMLKALGYLE